MRLTRCEHPSVSTGPDVKLSFLPVDANVGGAILQYLAVLNTSVGLPSNQGVELPTAMYEGARLVFLGDDVAGTVRMSPRTHSAPDGRRRLLTLGQLTVLPRYRRQGVATAVLDAAGSEAAAAGAAGVALFSELEDFFEQAGFQSFSPGEDIVLRRDPLSPATTTSRHPSGRDKSALRVGVAEAVRQYRDDCLRNAGLQYDGVPKRSPRHWGNVEWGGAPIPGYGRRFLVYGKKGFAGFRVSADSGTVVTSDSCPTEPLINAVAAEVNRIESVTCIEVDRVPHDLSWKSFTSTGWTLERKQSLRWYVRSVRRQSPIYTASSNIWIPETY